MYIIREEIKKGHSFFKIQLFLAKISHSITSKNFMLKKSSCASTFDAIMLMEVKKMKQYKSKDIYHITGLSRSQVNDYSDVITPFRYETEANHKVYDQASLEKFKKVAICKKFRISRKDIKSYIVKDADIGKILKEQSQVLRSNAKFYDKLANELDSLLACDLKEFFNQENDESFKKFIETE